MTLQRRGARHQAGPWPTGTGYAKSLGAKTYFTGRPCRNGHLCPRDAQSGGCLDCAYEYAVRRKATEPELAEYRRSYARQYARERRKNRPDVVAVERARGREYDRTPGRRERQNETRKRRRATDDEYRNKLALQARPSQRKWKENNKEAVRAHTRNRRARVQQVGGSHTSADIAEIQKRQKFKCAECGVSTRHKYHADHIMPIALGGDNAASNIQILCPTCNDRKGAKHPIQWARVKGRLV